NYSVEGDVRMRAGESVTIHDYRFTFGEVRDITGPTCRGGVALIGVTRPGEPEAVLHAERRLYNTSRMVM
ncbi:cytochrome c-type biogenesis CcmF C-terminal domain-containing protein, partial [Salmonella enterica]|uniref:cytochrome c-type biogenesis CcmF C-terminal domain-containing protein n=1 Tax=Salmonella enterica TaxID=28901 RepID=UPI003297D29D